MRGAVLRVDERDDILRGIAVNLSARVIAVGLGRDPSVVSREISRNGGRENYRVHVAQGRFESLRVRPESWKREADRRLHDEVNAGLARRRSPRQISAWMRREHLDDEAMRVSHGTIYEALYVQARGGLRTELKLSLRQGRAWWVAHGSTWVKAARIAGVVSISERPAEVADRAVPGYWEGGLIIGKGGRSQVATLVERSSRLVVLLRVPHDRTADRVALILSMVMRRLPGQLARSLTWDQGVELAVHATFIVATDIPVFFCDPHSPWRRGSNENTNGLIRQFLPKGTDLSGYTQMQLDEIADMLNGRLRQALGWGTPVERLNSFLIAAGDALTT